MERYAAESWAYRYGAPGEAIDCEAGGYADPAVATVWRCFVTCVFMLAVVVIEHLCSRGRWIVELSLHLNHSEEKWEIEVDLFQSVRLSNVVVDQLCLFYHGMSLA